MKKYFLLIALCSTGLAAFSQTIDEIYSKYVTAAGGPAAEKIKTMKMTAQLTVQGMELPMTQQIIAGRGVKTDVAVMGTEVQMAYLDGKGWKVNQFAGFPEATAMDAGELAGQREQTSVVSPLFDSKKN